ncbi:TPA: hypothetical protein DF272_05855 [Candidatus Falkowbacteria bacterium]|nr:hypothetical protein [Candidatus Falkowbacteria bacterium]
MFTVITVIMVMISLMVHEFGHGWAMTRHQIPIKEAGIGFGRKWIPHFWFEWRGVPIKVTPLILGGYVMPAEESEKLIENASYKVKAEIFGAGVLGNILFFYVMQVLAIIIHPEWGFDWIYLGLPFWAITSIVAVMLLFRRFCFEWLFIMIGLAQLGFLVYALFIHNPFEVMAGPVGVVNLAVVHPADDWTVTMADVFSRAGLISLLIGLTNMLPLFPLDGGRIMAALFHRFNWNRVKNFYTVISSLAMLGLIILALTSDVVKLLR